jgi:uncharacterized membrane protein YfcA
VDAVTVGGGLDKLPAQLIALPAASPSAVLATNKITSIFSTSAADNTYNSPVRHDLRTALPKDSFDIDGSALGALLAYQLPRSVFTPVVIVLLVAVAAFTAVRPDFGQLQALRWADRRRHHVAAGVGGAVIGFYDGIFGPGTGAFLVVLLVALLGYSLIQASAKARIVNLATNFGALIVFVPQGAPMWALGLAMGACNVAGGWLGAHTAITRGNRFVRVVFLGVVSALVLRLGWDVVT